MKKQLYISILLFSILVACEDIYVPELDQAEGIIVVDARIVNGRNGNFVSLSKTLSFNDKSEVYPPVEGATVLVADSRGGEVKLKEIRKGVFNADVPLDPALTYKLKITTGSDDFESDYQEVPGTPALDTVYGEETVKILDIAATKNVNDFEKSEGVQLFTDIHKKGKLPFYRFYARKVLQYNYEFQIGDQESHTMYCWKSLYPSGTFNIAAPDEYSSSADINRHPVEFFEKLPYKYLTAKDYPAGWIYMLYMYGLNGTSYNYYRDLNKQLDATGKIFDPMYVQPEGNIRCTSNPGIFILGNFEISSFREYRYFVNFSSSGKSFKIIPVFKFYDIPAEGVRQDIPPDFWQR